MSIAEQIIRAKTDYDEVYAAGVEAGKLQGGYDEGYEEGKQAEYDRFWDNYQQNGERVDYTNGFGSCWTKETFKPKYDIKPTNAYMFMRFAPLDKVDMVEHLEKLGITLDFSNCTNCQYGFYGAKISRLGVMDLRKIKGASAVGVLSTSYLKTIDLLKVSEEQTDLNWFSDTSALENITIEGVIDANLNMSKSSLLTKDSLMSIINALKPLVTYEEVVTDYTDSGYTIFGPPAGMGMWDHNTWYKIDRFEKDYHDIYIVGNDGYTYQFQLSMAEVDDAIKNATHFRGSYYSETDHYFAVKSSKATTGETKTLTLGSTNLAKLTDGEKAIATEKGWTIA